MDFQGILVKSAVLSSRCALAYTPVFQQFEQHLTSMISQKFQGYHYKSVCAWNGIANIEKDKVGKNPVFFEKKKTSSVSLNGIF